MDKLQKYTIANQNRQLMQMNRLSADLLQTCSNQPILGQCSISRPVFYFPFLTFSGGYTNGTLD